MTGGTSLAVQWLRLCASTAGGTGLIPGQGSEVPHATQCRHKKLKYGVAKKIHPGFSIRCDRKARANFLANPMKCDWRHSDPLMKM